MGKGYQASFYEILVRTKILLAGAGISVAYTRIQ
jgi:hypothetical protein